MNDDGVELSRKLRKALGYIPEPGKCQDCGGSGKVPAPELTNKQAIWKDCPSCKGHGLGGTS